jgi:hypothetical protein
MLTDILEDHIASIRRVKEAKQESSMKEVVSKIRGWQDSGR